MPNRRPQSGRGAGLPRVTAAIPPRTAPAKTAPVPPAPKGTQALLSFDTDRIKDYVFATDNLRDIRGASGLLDRLNREEMPATVRRVAPGAETIYANGGGGMFLVNANRSDAAREAVERRYAEVTHTGSVTGATAGLPPGTKPADNVNDILRLLSYRLRAAKDWPPPFVTEVTHALMRPCDACGRYAGSESWAEPGGETVRLCASCYAKREEDAAIRHNDFPDAGADGRPGSQRARSLWDRLAEELRAADYPLPSHPQRPVDIDELGRASQPEGYVGLIVADGDGMGQELERLQSLNDLRKFAVDVDQSVYKALAAAFAAVAPAGPAPDMLPFDVLLLGGDDVVALTTAHTALDVAVTLVERFSTFTASRRTKPLCLSASVVLAHAHYPFGSLRQLADSGLKFAKKAAAERRAAGESLDTGLINFLVVTSSGHLDFGEYYEQTLRSESRVGGRPTLVRTMRPYTPAGLSKLLAFRREDLDGAPSTKLQQLREACFLDEPNSRIAALSALLHWRPASQREALLRLLGLPPSDSRTFPWVPHGQELWTPLVDLTEIYDFVRPAGSE